MSQLRVLIDLGMGTGDSLTCELENEPINMKIGQEIAEIWSI
jgi:hypothetical protein